MVKRLWVCSHFRLSLSELICSVIWGWNPVRNCFQKAGLTGFEHFCERGWFYASLSSEWGNLAGIQQDSVTPGKRLMGRTKTNSWLRDDLGFYVRSTWEANYARYLKFLVKHQQIYDFEHEPDTFYFEVRRGTRRIRRIWRFGLPRSGINIMRLKAIRTQKAWRSLSVWRNITPKKKSF